jgi:hypothetical protein
MARAGGASHGKKKGTSRAGRPKKVKVTPKRRFRRLQYAQDRMDEAIRLVKEKTMTLGEASRHGKK